MSWTKHEPAWDFIPPKGEFRWSILEGSNPERVSKFSKALDDWRISMSCSFDPVHVDRDENLDLLILCSDPPFSYADHGKIATGRDDSKNVAAIWVRPDLCDNAGPLFFLHATGHGIGLADSQRWYPTTMDGFSIMPEAWDGNFPELERDGMRIFSLKNGAPGCGDEDPKWSWEIDPDYYSAYPKTPPVDLAVDSQG